MPSPPNCPSRFDLRIENLRGNSFQEPIVEVIDTLDTVRIYLEECELWEPKLAVELTKMILNRKATTERNTTMEQMINA